ncbi:hypothetical protein PGTUg99_008696 [Puccinia graminis f. sp. tritici]|uniref:Uncharacterized protein n=1 Tax=Puccinia graminis f. sp. tritici TaxID=56615 RepID=A0A5B0RZK2_PUCGR|nr:hypothetical protein PGTUg99_008696 [Puccinia graminis f. sp. tritici]
MLGVALPPKPKPPSDDQNPALGYQADSVTRPIPPACAHQTVANSGERHDYAQIPPMSIGRNPSFPRARPGAVVTGPKDGLFVQPRDLAGNLALEAYTQLQGHRGVTVSDPVAPNSTRCVHSKFHESASLQDSSRWVRQESDLQLLAIPNT